MSCRSKRNGNCFEAYWQCGAERARLRVRGWGAGCDTVWARLVALLCCSAVPRVLLAGSGWGAAQRAAGWFLLLAALLALRCMERPPVPCCAAERPPVLFWVKLTEGAGGDEGSQELPPVTFQGCAVSRSKARPRVSCGQLWPPGLNSSPAGWLFVFALSSSLLPPRKGSHVLFRKREVPLHFQSTDVMFLLLFCLFVSF